MYRQVENYKQQLLAAGFQQASLSPNCFFRPDTALTAFFVNLKVFPNYLCIFYGDASTAFTRMAGSENSLIERGIWEKDGCLRFYTEIHTEADAQRIKSQIAECFYQHRGIEKDVLLKLIQNRRKAFLDQITTILKPLGFRKKGNQWQRPLSDKIVLQFWANKSSYADLYYFEVDIYSLVSTRGLCCYHTRLHKLSVDKFSWKDHAVDSDDFDWQVQSAEELSAIVERALKQYLLPIQNTPLSELGNREFIWKGCICPRDCCETCWVQKNLWEVNRN